MKKKYLLLTLILGSLSVSSFGFTFKEPTKIEKVKIESNKENKTKELYKELGLESKLDYNVFEKAYKGYEKISGKKKELLTIVDYAKPSTQERFFVVDLSKKKVLISSHVAHGRNSGGNIATSFSNKMSSYKSSLGFYLTENTYMGGNGYSLVLDGLEKGINDKAKERYIVIHGADYANPKIAKSQGRLGRSLGCPALPRNIYKEAINLIKGGSVVFVNGNDPSYLDKSQYV
ncbi:murein L,D-transpeptidase catalytic domain family protein [Cetobacterium sp. 8H]|uniref:murein L,D-transpeptidase catalytic domain family protein n=1 Tax=Cetobacterium sp. 8H TaxID=2759681 RepID=UPI00163BF71B|nr:murein L,D-transpeptidase catalytic domain family protein [Cetobacterium sp. 8H]MBC2851758.1 murein L,D-transpeptidase catalytic domain family protein [Cetobacterium sp. 8H]